MLPVLFEIPTPWGSPIAIYSYGLMLGLALVVGYQLVLRMALRRGEGAASAGGLTEATVGNAYIVTAVLGLVGARLLYVMFNRELLQDSGAAWYDVTAGGVSAYGGFLGGLLGAAIYLKLKGASLLEFADAAAPALGAGTVLTRLGCYLYGSDFGTRLAEDAPGWLRSLGTFPNGSPPFHHHHARYGLAPDAAASFPVHPTQLYEGLFGVVLLLIALSVLQARRFRGQVILITAGAYGSFRFLIEYVRDDPERGHAMGFSSPQLFSLLMVPTCAVIYSSLLSRHRRQQASKVASA
ncbi:MAG: prolipoprotein diacylglyceryl transferase [Myxococcales bacterium]|nr:prolipoprotein diacylglyceryl transferase [Myxococcales bacterium]